MAVYGIMSYHVIDGELQDGRHVTGDATVYLAQHEDESDKSLEETAARLWAKLVEHKDEIETYLVYVGGLDIAKALAEAIAVSGVSVRRIVFFTRPHFDRTVRAIFHAHGLHPFYSIELASQGMEGMKLALYDVLEAGRPQRWVY